MTNDSTLNLIQILQATFTILENTDYPAKDSKEVADLMKCLQSAIAEIESAFLQKSALRRL